MNKKFYLCLVILALIAIFGLFSISSSRQDFDGLFEMNVPFGEKFEDMAICWPNGKLGCMKEYWNVNAGCQLGDDDIVVFYYDESNLIEGESNALQHALNTLTTSYFFQFVHNEGDLMILTNDLGSQNMPSYLVGVANDDSSKVVFVGGHNFNKVKNHANSIEFK